MKIRVSFEDKVYHRTCSHAYRWTGVVKDSPDWLTDMLGNDEAIVAKSNRDIMFTTINGYPRACIGDIIVRDGQNIDVIRSTEQ